MPRLGTSILTRLSAVSELFGDLLRLANATVRSQGSLVAENLFLRKQLAFYQEREVGPRRLTDAARLTLVFWSRWFNWKDALIIVKPETLIGWQRKGFRLFWRWKSKPGRPRLPKNIRELIVRMGESDLGTSASCLGTVPEVGNLRFAQDGAGLLALAARQPITENLLAALANLCTESRAVPDCL